MNVKFSEDLRNARLQQIVDLLGANGNLTLYTGTQPIGGGASSNSIVLGTLSLSPVAGVVSGGQLTFNPISDDVSADNNGFVTWGRFTSAAGIYVVDADCGNSDSTAAIRFTNTLFAVGDVIKIDSIVIVEGNS